MQHAGVRSVGCIPAHGAIPRRILQRHRTGGRRGGCAAARYGARLRARAHGTRPRRDVTYAPVLDSRLGSAGDTCLGPFIGGCPASLGGGHALGEQVCGAPAHHGRRHRTPPPGCPVATVAGVTAVRRRAGAACEYGRHTLAAAAAAPVSSRVSGTCRSAAIPTGSYAACSGFVGKPASRRVLALRAVLRIALSSANTARPADKRAWASAADSAGSDADGVAAESEEVLTTVSACFRAYPSQYAASDEPSFAAACKFRTASPALFSKPCSPWMYALPTLSSASLSPDAALDNRFSCLSVSPLCSAALPAADVVAVEARASAVCCVSNAIQAAAVCDTELRRITCDTAFHTLRVWALAGCML